MKTIKLENATNQKPTLKEFVCHPILSTRALFSKAQPVVGTAVITAKKDDTSVKTPESAQIDKKEDKIAKPSKRELEKLNAQLLDACVHLRFGCQDEDFARAREAILKGADVNARTSIGETPLILAAGGHGADNVVEFLTTLIENGADVNALDECGVTALMWASYSFSDKSARLLIQHGADVNARAEDGRTALLYAASNWSDSAKQGIDSGIAKLLIENGADVNARDKNGTTALMEASFRMNDGVANLLIDNGADIDGALDKVLNRNNLGFVRRLLEKGAKLEA